MIIVSIIIICIVGTLLHFVYELSGHNKIVALFAAVNESTWEHIKIAMTPTLLWSIYDIYKYGFTPSFLIAKSHSLLAIIIIIPILFYSYSIFTKKSILVVDVICFYITIICSQLLFNYFVNISNYSVVCIYLSVSLLVIELIMYFVFSYLPLHNFIFKDPISHKYGLEGHTEMHNHDHKEGDKHE